MITMNKDGLIQKINTFEDARSQLNSTSYYVLVKNGRVVFSECYGIKRYYFHKYEKNIKHVLAYLKWLKRYEKYETVKQQNLHRLPGPFNAIIGGNDNKLNIEFKKIDMSTISIFPATTKLKQICMAVNSEYSHPFIACKLNQKGFAEEDIETLVDIATRIDQLVRAIRTTDGIIDAILNGKNRRCLLEIIEQNRALMELMLKEIPDFTDRFPLVQEISKDNDDFLCSLAKISDIENYFAHETPRPFPRPWPVEDKNGNDGN